MSIFASVEIMEQQAAQRAALAESGKEEAFMRRLRNRVEKVLAGVQGRRNLGNLFGLRLGLRLGIRPVSQQELFYHDDDELHRDIPWVAGKRFGFGINIGEGLVDRLMVEYEQKGELVSLPVVPRKEGSLIVVEEVFRSPLGIDFRRKAYREDRGGEFVPGFPSEFASRWDVVRSA